MSKIYSTFSNPGGDLESVKREFGDILNFFNSDKIKRKVDYGFALNASVDQITSAIVAGQKEIRLFHFSGHSGGSGLDFPEDDFSADHLVRFFNTVSSDRSKIECVFLNGCENATIVERLDQVPVVIGTRSKIQDQIAHKFTRDFMGALVESESSYKQAFMDAVSAQNNLDVSIVDRTRGVRREDEVDLNDYFIVINDAAVAGRSFPFKRPKQNWVRNLVLLLAAVLLALFFIFKDDIIKPFKGYTCSPIRTEEGKCNFVIADFTHSQIISDFNSWLYSNIRDSRIIDQYLHAINLGTFDKVIHNNAVDRDELPELCKYDFNLTGSFIGESGRYRAEFNISPFDSITGDAQTFVYHVESIDALDTLITFLDSASSNQFVLFEMCAACAEIKDLVIIKDAMESLTADYAYSAATAESYQRMQYRMSRVALKYADTTLALKSLDAITRAANNDFVLKALEQQADLYKAQNNVQAVYQVQTRALEEMQARSNNPAAYQLSKPVARYSRATQAIRLQRADLVLKHRNDALIQYRDEAKRDYEQLDRTRYLQRDYSDEIRVLQAQGIQPGNFNTGLIEGAVIDPSHLQPVQPDPEAQLMRSIPVRISAFRIRQRDFDKILNQLKEQGYQVDTEQSQILSRAPAQQPGPTVYYRDVEHARLCQRIADFMTEATGKEFGIQLQRSNTALTHAAPAQMDIRVYWPG